MGQVTFRGLVLAAAFVALACKSKPTPPPVPVEKVFPAFDATCARDEDCTTTDFTSSCCQVCEPTFGSKSWVARVEAYCEAHPGTVCEPQACSVMVGPPKCVSGQCYPGR